MKSSFILLVVVLLQLSSYAQQNKKEVIRGYWISVKKELKDGQTGENVTLDGKPYKPNMKMNFVKDSIMVYQGGFEATLKYEIHDNYLVFGTKKYLIEELDKENMILSEVKTGAFKVEFRRYFKRKLNEDK